MIALAALHCRATIYLSYTDGGGDTRKQPTAKRWCKRMRIISVLFLSPTVFPLPVLILGQSCRLAGFSRPRWSVPEPLRSLMKTRRNERAGPSWAWTATCCLCNTQREPAVTNWPWRCVFMLWAREMCVPPTWPLCVWTVSHDDSPPLFRGSSHTSESLGEIRSASR